MSTLKEFWSTLSSIEKDQLRKLLSDSLFISTTTATAYINGKRNIPATKKNAFKDVIHKHFNISIELPSSNNIQM